MHALYIPMKAKTHYCEGHKVTVVLESDAHLRLPNGRRFGVGAIPRGESGRKVSFGPEEPGPWAFTYGLCTVIDNYPDRRKAEYDQDVLVSEGSFLWIDACVYKVEIERKQYINLIPVTWRN